MILRLVLSLALLGFAAPARAYDIFPSVYGVAEFPPNTDLINTGTVTPGGGRVFDFGQFGQGGALCSAYTGQADWLCASASASVDIDRQPVARFMTRTPKVISENALAVDALRLFEAYKIDDLIVVDARGKPLGLIDGQDLPKFKIV